LVSDRSGGETLIVDGWCLGDRGVVCLSIHALCDCLLLLSCTCCLCLGKLGDVWGSAGTAAELSYVMCSVGGSFGLGYV
jgi:hypothetical protein